MKQLKFWFAEYRAQIEIALTYFLKNLNEQNHLEETKRRFLVAIPFWVAGLSAALAAIVYARLFQYAESQAASMYSSIGYWILLVVPVMFVASLALVEFIAPFANGSGIPQLMASAELSSSDSPNKLLEKLLGVRIIISKVLSSIVGVAAGGAIGREGPTLQIAGSIFHLTGKLFSRGIISKNHHGMILAGGAAGLAAAFNTPLGGIAYVVEELSRSHLSNFRTGVLHAVIMAGIFAQIAMGPYLYFGYPKMEVFNFSDMGFVILYAAFAGVVAAIFSQALKMIVVQRAKLLKIGHRFLFAAGAGLVFAGITLFVGKSAVGSGKDLLNQLLFTTETARALDLVGRFSGSLATYASGGAGGIFAPTLAIGGASASFLNTFVDGGLGPLSVLIGMTAGLAALTHSPFTSFVLILEMTDRHSAIVPLMVAALVGQGLSRSISKTSFYEFVCHRILEANSETTEQTGAT